MSFLNQNTENLILQELFNLNHKFDKYQESNQRQFEELRGEIKTIKETMATKDELKALEAKMATKDELKALEARMATKEDLKRFATKEDLKKFATKEDLKDFVTKKDLKKEFDNQAEEIARIFHDTFHTLENREKKLRKELFSKIR